MSRVSPLGVAIRLAVVSASLIVASGITIGTVIPPGAELLSLALARTAAFTLGLLGIPASLEGAVINADGFLAIVAAQCTAIEILLLFTVVVLVCPVSARARMWALLLGIPAICALNFVRVISLLLVGVGFPDHFETIHHLVWQPAMAIIALVSWLLWLRWASTNNERSEEMSTP